MLSHPSLPKSPVMHFQICFHLMTFARFPFLIPFDPFNPLRNVVNHLSLPAQHFLSYSQQLDLSLRYFLQRNGSGKEKRKKKRGGVMDKEKEHIIPSVQGWGENILFMSAFITDVMSLSLGDITAAARLRRGCLPKCSPRYHFSKAFPVTNPWNRPDTDNPLTDRRACVCARVCARDTFCHIYRQHLLQ